MRYLRSHLVPSPDFLVGVRRFFDRRAKLATSNAIRNDTSAVTVGNSVSIPCHM